MPQRPKSMFNVDDFGDKKFISEGSILKDHSQKNFG